MKIRNCQKFAHLNGLFVILETWHCIASCRMYFLKGESKNCLMQGRETEFNLCLHNGYDFLHSYSGMLMLMFIFINNCLVDWTNDFNVCSPDTDL